MRRTLVISNRAERDLLEIWLWTREQFGAAQADRYLDDLGAGMRSCGARPEAGQDRNALRPGYRSRLIGRHVLFYTSTETQVVIQRVLHGSMDFGTHLPE